MPDAQSKLTRGEQVCSWEPEARRGAYGGAAVADDAAAAGSDASGHAWVAWEDRDAATWRPAACNPYVRIDFARFW